MRVNTMGVLKSFCSPSPLAGEVRRDVPREKCPECGGSAIPQPAMRVWNVERNECVDRVVAQCGSLTRWTDDQGVRREKRCRNLFVISEQAVEAKPPSLTHIEKEVGMRGSAIDKRQRARIVERVGKGEHPADVARDLGVHPNTARGICAKARIPWDRRRQTQDEKGSEMKTAEANKKLEPVTEAHVASTPDREHESESYGKALFYLQRMSHNEWRRLGDRQKASVDAILDAEAAS